MSRILLIEDHERLARLMCKGLVGAGIALDVVTRQVQQLLLLAEASETHNYQFGTVRVQGQHMGFRRLTTDHGLRDNTITCLYEDRAGHLWVGTAAGLHRFDGQRMAAIGCTNYTITAVVEDGAGVIWAATKDQGLLRLAPQRR